MSKNKTFSDQMLSILDNASIGFALYDADLRYLEINKRLADINGIPREAHIGHTVQEILPDLWPNLKDSFRQALEKGIAVEHVLTTGQTPASPGEQRYWLVSYYPTHGENNAINGIAVVVMDITDQKRAEAGASLQAEILRNMSEGAYLVKPDGTIAYTNPKFERMFGYRPGEMIGKNVSIVNAPTEKTPEETNEEIMSVLEKTGEWHGEVKNIRKDGTPFWCHVNISAFDDPQYGRVFVATHDDITDRKETEEQLQKSEVRYRTILNNVNDLLFIHDFKGNIVEVNENVCRVLGYTREELIGANLRMIDSGESAKQIKDRTARVIADGAGVFESIEIKKSGGMLPVEVSAKLVSLEGAGLIQSFVRDITSRRKAEDELLASRETLEKSLQGLVDTLALTVEVRDPYTAAHQRRVTDLSVVIAKEAGLPENDIAGLKMAAAIHDIGKIFVPAETLNKPGKISSIEFDLIKTHAQAGYDLVKDIKFEHPISEIIRQHHERLDGSGYPDGLKGNDIHQRAKIVAVADVVEAMCSHRPYRAALEEIEKNSGILYDPEFAAICLELFRTKQFEFK